VARRLNLLALVALGLAARPLGAEEASRTHGWLVFPTGLSGDYEVHGLEDRRLVVEVRLEPEGEARLVRLPVGRYLLRKRRAEDQLAGLVELQAGSRIEVRDGDMTRVGLADLPELERGGPAGGGLRLRYAARFGGEMFLDADTRADLFPSCLQGGLELSVTDLLAPGLSLGLDFLGGGGQADTSFELSGGARERVGVTFLRFELGLSLIYRLEWRWLSLNLGPRLTCLVASRSFHEPYQAIEAQVFSSLAPGAQAGLALHLGPLALLLELRLHYLYYHLDGGRSLGFGGLYLGLVYPRAGPEERHATPPAP
jgi:hypothetical protein